MFHVEHRKVFHGIDFVTVHKVFDFKLPISICTKQLYVAPENRTKVFHSFRLVLHSPLRLNSYPAIFSLFLRYE
jgi:hypothetical protein